MFFLRQRISKIFRIVNANTEKNAALYFIRPFSSKSAEDEILRWMDTLDETNRKKIRYIQNEVSHTKILL